MGRDKIRTPLKMPAWEATHMHPCNKTLHIVNVPPLNYMYCYYNDDCILAVDPRLFCFRTSIYFVPNLLCVKKNHGNLKCTPQYLKPNEFYCEIYCKSFQDFHALLVGGLLYDAVKACKMKP